MLTKYVEDKAHLYMGDEDVGRPEGAFHQTLHSLLVRRLNARVVEVKDIVYLISLVLQSEGGGGEEDEEDDM